MTLLNIGNRSLGIFFLTSRLFPRGFADTLPTARREPRESSGGWLVAIGLLWGASVDAINWKQH